MLDIGWQEIFIIGTLALIVVGPKDLPRALRTAMLGVKKVRGLAREFQSGVDEMVREADLDDFKKEMQRIKEEEIERDLKHGVVRNDLKGDLGLGEIKDDLNKIADDKPGTTKADATKPMAGGVKEAIAEAAPKSETKSASGKKPADGKTAAQPAKRKTRGGAKPKAARKTESAATAKSASGKSNSKAKSAPAGKPAAKKPAAKKPAAKKSAKATTAKTSASKQAARKTPRKSPAKPAASKS